MKFALCSTALLVTGIASAATPIDGWYASAFGGYTHLSSNINTNNFDGGVFRSDVDYQGGWNAGGRIGFQSCPMRYEFEYTYLSANAQRFQVNHISQTGVSGKAAANLLMANLYYDIPEFVETLSPFLGVGVGYALTKTTLSSTGPFGLTFFNANREAFAYQGTAGITYNFSENYALNASYRYTATPTSGRFGRSFQAQMGNVGIIYRFDTCCYN